MIQSAMVMRDVVERNRKCRTRRGPSDLNYLTAYVPGFSVAECCCASSLQPPASRDVRATVRSREAGGGVEGGANQRASSMSRLVSGRRRLGADIDANFCLHNAVTSIHPIEVATGTTTHDVMPAPIDGVQAVVPSTALQDIASGAAEDVVLARADANKVGALPSEDVIVAPPAVDTIVTSAAVHQVVTASCTDDVGPSSPLEVVVVRGARDRATLSPGRNREDADEG
jgi:hypothetical protein